MEDRGARLRVNVRTGERRVRGGFGRFPWQGGAAALVLLGFWIGPAAGAQDNPTGPARAPRVTRLVSPDGNRLAFSVAADSGGQRNSLVVCDLDGSNRRVVDTIPQQVWEVYWFGNDQLLSSWHEATGYEVAAVEGKKSADWTLPKGCDPLYMRPSPDGRWIAFVGSYTVAADERQHGLFVAERGKGTVRRLLDQAVKTAPAWSPDSRQLAIGNAAGYVCNYPLVLANVESGEVTDTGLKGVGAAWSPDGRFLAFGTDTVQGGSWYQGVPLDSRIGVLDLETKTLTRVSPPAWNRSEEESKRWEIGGALNPVWSPDSRWIAYHHRESTSVGSEDKKSIQETWVVDREGKEARKVLDSAPEVAWTPDAHRLVFIEGGRPERAEVFSLPAVAGPALAPAPAQFSAAQATATPTPAQPAFDPAPIFQANRAWQNPSLENLQSVSFVHSMKPKRLDERFVWRRDGTSLLEVVAREDDADQKEVGRRWITTPEPAQYYLPPKARLAKREDLGAVALADSLRDHLMGTRANCVAIDWGRNPDAFVIRAAEGVGTKDLITLRLVPRDPEYSLNAGAMFQTTSWGYVHDLRIQKVEMTVDPKTWRTLREVDYSGEGKKECEIEFTDWIDAGEGHSVPGRIHFFFPATQFDVDYRFQWHPEGLWILASGDATFKGQEPQIETIVDLTVNGPTPDLDRALSMVHETQEYLNASSEQTLVRLPLSRFLLGKTMPLRPAAELAGERPASQTEGSVEFTLAPGGELLAEMDLAGAERVQQESTQTTGTAVLVLWDEAGHSPLAAVRTEFPSIGPKPGMHPVLQVGSSKTLAKTRFFTVSIRMPGLPQFQAFVAGTEWQNRAIAAFPPSVDKPVPLDLHEEGDLKTRLKRLTFTRNENGQGNASVEAVSEDAWKIFDAIIPVILLSKDNVAVAAGTGAIHFQVEREIAECHTDIALGSVPATPDIQWVVLGLRRGEDTGQYHGHGMWMTLMRDDPWIFPIPDLLAADDPRVWRQGLRALDQHLRNRDLENELFRDLRRRDRTEKSGSARSKKLAPYLDRLVQLLDHSDDPEDRVIICRLLGHSGDTKFRDLLAGRLTDPHDRVKDAAAIGLGLLGDAAGQARLGPILQRPLPTADDTSLRRVEMEWKSDAGAALAVIGSDSALQTLGEGLLTAVDGIVITPVPTGGQTIGGTYFAAQRLLRVLGNTQNPQALPWLQRALDRGVKGDQVKHEAAEVLRQFKDPATVMPVYIDGIRRADGYLIQEAPRDPALVPAIATMLQREDLNEYALGAAADFLKQLNDPKALELLRAAHARTWPDEYREARVKLAEALAAYGDPSGLPDAFQVLVTISDPSTLPEDKSKRSYEEHSRERLRQTIQTVFKSEKLQEKDLVEFLRPQLESPDAATRRVALDGAGFLRRIPEALNPLVEKARNAAPSPTP